MTKSVFNVSNKVTHKLGDRLEISDSCNAQESVLSYGVTVQLICALFLHMRIPFLS